jgi:hypothetical protein
MSLLDNVDIGDVATLVTNMVLALLESTEWQAEQCSDSCVARGEMLPGTSVELGGGHHGSADESKGADASSATTSVRVHL